MLDKVVLQIDRPWQERLKQNSYYHSLYSAVCFSCSSFFLKSLIKLNINGLIYLAMSKICQICGKQGLKGNLVPRGVGKRVTRRTLTMRQPNLRVKRFSVDGNTIKMILCASCLKRIKFDAKKAEAAVAAEK